MKLHVWSIQLPSFNVFFVETGYWGGTYCRKELLKERLRRCFHGTHVLTERRLNCCTAAERLCDLWPLTSLCGNMCSEVRMKRINLTSWVNFLPVCVHFCHIAHRCRFGSMIVFASIAELKGLSEWFHSVLGSWDRESKTAHSHLISAQPFPRPNTAGAPGKWERNITFPFRRRGMWHGVDGFCRIGSPEARLSFFFWSRNVG